MKLWLHQVKGNWSSTFPISYWLKYPQRVTGISLRIGKQELVLGKCMTIKKLANLISEDKETAGSK